MYHLPVVIVVEYEQLYVHPVLFLNIYDLVVVFLISFFCEYDDLNVQ